MKASDLIMLLAKIISETGDLEVMGLSDEFGDNERLTSVEVKPLINDGLRYDETTPNPALDIGYGNPVIYLDFA